MKKGVMNTSRRESNFINRMNSEQREQYIKRFIAACNPEQLIPSIEITKHDKYFREIEYVINGEVSRLQELINKSYRVLGNSDLDEKAKLDNLYDIFYDNE